MWIILWAHEIQRIADKKCYLKHEVKCSEVSQSCPTLCEPMDCSPPGSSDHGILQARILEWVAISFSRGSSWPRDRTQVSRIVGRRFNLWDGVSLQNIRILDLTLLSSIFLTLSKSFSPSSLNIHSNGCIQD